MSVGMVQQRQGTQISLVRVLVMAKNANNSKFIGLSAGQGATGASNSNFFGQNAGRDASSANQSNFFGSSAGQDATNANYSNFIGMLVFSNLQFYSNFFGYYVGNQK
jgi:hypothetical protein